MAKDQFPAEGSYRGVALHAFQPPERIERVVKPAIDAVHDMADLLALADYAERIYHPPEARLLAAAKCQAFFDIAVDERRRRPTVDMDRVRGAVAGLSRDWMSPTHYCSLLDVPAAPGQPGAAARDKPLPADRTYG